MKKRMHELQKKLTKRRPFQIVFVLLVIVLLAGALSRVISVQAFDVYELTEDNDLIITFTQKKASGSAAYRYGTDSWWLSSKKMNGAKSNLTSSAYSQSTVTKVTTSLVSKGTPDANGMYEEKQKMAAEDIVAWASGAYGKDTIIAGTDGEPGVVKAYASRTFKVYKNDVDVGKIYYCYDDIANALSEWGQEWSGGTLKALKRSYDKEIILKFKLTDFTVKIVDEATGKEIAGYSFNTETYIFGETVNKTAPDILNYDCVGYNLVGPNGIVYSGSTGDFSRLLKSSELGSGDEGITLTFIYRNNVPTAPPQPSNPTSGAPVPSVTGTPTPTATPTTPPSPTPTTSVTLKEAEKSVEYYFTTDKGYTLNEIANNTGYKLAGYMAYYSTGTMADFAYLKRDSSYPVGEDSEGNTWYFIPDGANATWVHPAVYNGYDADTTDVQYITELIFPSYLTHNGTSYKVVSIGGGSSTYRTPGSQVTVSQSSTTDAGTYYQNVDYSYGWYDDLVVQSNSYRSTSIGYEYGILGNGAITSAGSLERDSYISNSQPETQNNYWANYFVYNTTLEKIVIPDTVTTICDNAFLYCEALTTIEGAVNVTSIGKKSFMGANVKKATISYAYSTSTSTSTMEVDKNYYYNMSTSKTSKTAVMTAWENSVLYHGMMPLSAFVKLKTLGTYSFAYHKNIGTVILSETVTGIGADAFMGCDLDSIVIPNAGTVVNTSASNKQNTLGTKGRIRKEERTIIYTSPDANAFTYGRTYKFYYNLMAGYPVNYHPNGGTPDETVSYNSVMEDIKLPGGEWLTGNHFIHDGKRYSIGTSSSGVATVTEHGAFTMPGTVLEWINKNTMSDYSGFLYETDSGEIGIWFVGRDSKIPLPAGSTFLGYQYKYNSSSSYYMYVYYVTADNKIYRTYRNYSSDSNTWSSAYQIFTSEFTDGEYTYAIPYEPDSDGTHRFALVREDTSYDYYYIFSMENLPTGKIETDSDAGTTQNYTYTSVYKGTALPDGMKKQLAECFFISTDNRLYFSGRYEEEATYITLPYSITGETYVMNAYYDSSQYAYVKFIDSAGRVFYVKCSDARSTASRYFTPIIKYCGQLSSGVTASVYVGGAYFYIDGNGYYYYVTDTALENNPAFTNLLKEDGSKFRGQTTCGNLLKTTSFLVDLDGYYYTLDYTYDANNVRVNTAKAFMLNGIHFMGLDGEIVEQVLIETGYLHGYTSSSSYYYEYYLTDKGTLYVARGSSGATTRLYLEKLTPDGVSLTKLMWDREESYHYLSLFAFDSEGGLWALGYNYYGELGHATGVGEGNTATSLKTLYKVDNGHKFKEIFRFSQGTYALDENNNLYRAGQFYENKEYINIKEFTRLDVLDGMSSSEIYDVKEAGSYLYLLTDYGCVSIYDTLYYTPAEYVADLGYEFIADIYANEFFTRNGYNFTGWNTAADGTGETYLPGARLALTEELDLYAQWEVKAPTIHYNANGGSGGMADTVLPFGTTATYLAKNRFYRTDYRFKEWNTMPDGSGVSYADEAYITGVTGEITLYAQWEEVVVTYTLVYMKYPYGSAGNTAWKTKTMVNSVSNTTSETIEGQPFTPTGYTVRYDLNPKSTMSTAPVMGMLTDANITTSAPVFNRWQLREPDADGVHRYYGDNFAPGDVVSRLTETDGTTLYLYPTWGGSGSYVLLPDATCEGYTLAGWCELPDGSSEIYYPNDEDSDEVSTYVPVKDTTLYAIWEAEQEEYLSDFVITGTTDKAAGIMLEDGQQALTIKKGHAFSYAFFIDVQTVSQIKITPSYFWISENGAMRKEAVVYYHIVQNASQEYFVVAGSERDTRNGQKNGTIFLENCEREAEWNRWDGNFLLPSELFVVCEENQTEFEAYRKNHLLTGQEAFFEKTGYLMVSYQIEFQVEEEWLLYDGWQQTEMAGDALAAGWHWIPGDVIRYDLGKSSAEDYTVGGVE